MSFRESFIKHTSVTTGTGALTLVAASAPYVSYTVAVTAAFGTGTFEVEYVIEEPSTGQWEIGVGSLVTSTNVLTRTLPSKTYTGSTLDYTAPSAINFASGSTIVYVGDSLEATPMVFPGTGNISGVLGASTTFGSGVLIPNMNTSTGALVAGTEYYTPILWNGTHQIDQVSLRTNSATTGNCKLNWYECKQSGIPGALLKSISSGATSFPVGGSSTTSVLAITGFNPPPGWYVVGSIFDAAITANLPAFPSALNTPFGCVSTGASITGYTRTGNFGTGLADPASTSSPSAQTGGSPTSPGFGFRMAA